MSIHHRNWSGLLLHPQRGTEALTLINDQHFGGFPPIECGLAPPYVLDVVIEIILLWRNRSPRMDGHTWGTKQGGRSVRSQTPENALNFKPRWTKENIPPMFEAAIPVLAVTDTAVDCFAYFFLRATMMAWSSSDFPVPGRCESTGVRGWRVVDVKEARTCSSSEKNVVPLVHHHLQHPLLFTA